MKLLASSISIVHLTMSTLIVAIENNERVSFQDIFIDTISFFTWRNHKHENRFFYRDFSWEMLTFSIRKSLGIPHTDFQRYNPGSIEYKKTRTLLYICFIQTGVKINSDSWGRSLQLRTARTKNENTTEYTSTKNNTKKEEKDLVFNSSCYNIQSKIC